MSCDMHLHTEIKIAGRWHHYNHSRVPQSYKLFGYVAGVRNMDVEPVVAPKGYPDDMSVVTRLDYANWLPDAHHVGWLDAEEILRLTDMLEADEELKEFVGFQACDAFGYLFGNSYAGFTRYPEDRPHGVDDVRFVFWFDN